MYTILILSLLSEIKCLNSIRSSGGTPAVSRLKLDGVCTRFLDSFLVKVTGNHHQKLLMGDSTYKKMCFVKSKNRLTRKRSLKVVKVIHFYMILDFIGPTPLTDYLVMNFLNG